MLTIDDLKRLEVLPDPSLGEAAKNHFRRGADQMKAEIINAIRNGYNDFPSEGLNGD